MPKIKMHYIVKRVKGFSVNEPKRIALQKTSVHRARMAVAFTAKREDKRGNPLPINEVGLMIEYYKPLNKAERNSLEKIFLKLIDKYNLRSDR